MFRLSSLHGARARQRTRVIEIARLVVVDEAGGERLLGEPSSAARLRNTSLTTIRRDPSRAT